MNIVDVSNELASLISGPNAYHNLPVARLVEKVLARKEGFLTNTGAVSVTTGKYTGRSPEDKFIVEEDSVKHLIDWGPVNKPISSEVFEKLYLKVIQYLKNRDEIYVFNGFAGADKNIVFQFKWSMNWHGKIYLLANCLSVRKAKTI